MTSVERATIGRRIVGMNSSSTVRLEFENVTVLTQATEVFLHSEVRRFGSPTGALSTKSYELQQALGPETSDDELFTNLGAPLVDSALEGGRSCVIAFGQTGSGKTHTSRELVRKSSLGHSIICPRTHGRSPSYPQVQRSAKRIFDLIQSEALQRISVHVSFLENQGSRCFDLLHNRTDVVLRDNGQGGIVCAGLSELHCETFDDFMATVAMGNELRATAATAANEVSSRSHAVCSLVLRRQGKRSGSTTAPAKDSEHGEVHGTFRIVDLAGSERVKDTANHSLDRLRETKEINSSLSCLKDCIRALFLAQRGAASDRGNSVGYVPFRNSKLTLLLRDCFRELIGEVRPKTLTTFIAHACPVASGASHTQSTLDYASAILATSRAAKERYNCVGPEKWTPEQVMEWVVTLQNGRLKTLAGAVRYSGKALSVVWRGELVDNFKARGGSVSDADLVYEEFRKLLKQTKAAASKDTVTQPRPEIGAASDVSQPLRPYSFSGLGSDPASILKT